MMSASGEPQGSPWEATPIVVSDPAAKMAGPHGYAAEPSPESGVGGWLAHRDAVSGLPGSGPAGEDGDWVAAAATDLASAITYRPPGASLTHRPRMLVLYGSLRPTSYSRLLAHECARLLEAMGADVRVYCPRGLPVRDPALEDDAKVQELRALSEWSEGQVWVCPELYGLPSGAFKNQIDWLPLNTGSVRPTQGRTCAVLQVRGWACASGGSSLYAACMRTCMGLWVVPLCWWGCGHVRVCVHVRVYVLIDDQLTRN